MLGEIVSLPVRIVRTVGALPGRLEGIERSMTDMQRLLAAAIERLDTIEGHTQGMHGQLGRIDEHTADLNEHTQGLGDNTAQLVRIAQPLERVGRRRGFRGRRANGTSDAAGAESAPSEDAPVE